jgi:hypothetical protein
VVLTATLPGNLSASIVPAYCNVSGSTVQCSLGDLAPGAQVIVSLTCTAGATGNTAVSFNVSSDLPDTASANNVAVASVSVLPPGDEVDTPTLPQWGALLLGALLLGSALLPQAGLRWRDTQPIKPRPPMNKA